jgi:hypothetical protein
MIGLRPFLYFELERLVGARGFEPRTPCAQGRCATRLRYAPTVVRCYDRYYEIDYK